MRQISITPMGLILIHNPIRWVATDLCYQLKKETCLNIFHLELEAISKFYKQCIYI